MSVPISNNALIRNINKTVYRSISSHHKLSKRKTVDEVVTEDVLKKVREIAYKDAENGDSASPRKEIIELLSNCRGQVGPDRKALLSEAQQQMDKDIQQFALKKSKRPETLLEYILEMEGKFDSGNGSYEAQRSSGGHTYMKIYDENGELTGTFDSNSGFHIHHTSAEKQVEQIIAQEYNDAFTEHYSTVKSQARNMNTFSLDTHI